MSVRGLLDAHCHQWWFRVCLFQCARTTVQVLASVTHVPRFVTLRPSRCPCHHWWFKMWLFQCARTIVQVMASVINVPRFVTARPSGCLTSSRWSTGGIATVVSQIYVDFVVSILPFFKSIFFEKFGCFMPQTKVLLPSPASAPKGRLGCLMSPPCLESQGCHLIPLYYLLSCTSA